MFSENAATVGPVYMNAMQSQLADLLLVASRYTTSVFSLLIRLLQPTFFAFQNYIKSHMLSWFKSERHPN